MPTLTKVSESYQNEAIECAKLVFTEPGTYKFPHVVNAATDYEFQFVCKTASATTITIQLGDTVKTQAITTSWVRYVIAFPAVTNDNDSLYMSFPAGTYYLYNLQMERATTPSGWRPAPEDAEDYADKAAQQAVDDQTQLDVFNKLTNNGTAQGVYLLDGQLYINGEYIAADTISGNKIHGGTISGTQIDIGDGVFTVDENGEVTAANLNMTGGTLNLQTAIDSFDFISLAYTVWKSLFRADQLSLEYNGTQKRHIQVSPMGIRVYLDANNTTLGMSIWPPSDDTSASSCGIKLYDGAGTDRVIISNSGITIKNSSGGSAAVFRPPISSGSSATGALTLYDGAGTRRVELTNSGLNFYNSSGTLTKTYSAT